MPARLAARSAALVGALVVLGAACGGDTPDNPSAATVTIRPESYTRRPAPTTVPPGGAPVTTNVEGTTDAVQNYTVQAGDYPSTIADDFEVSLQELLNINDWTLVGGQVPEFEGEGQQIKIPPGAIVPTATTTTTAPVNPRPTTTTEGGGDSDPSGPTTTLGDRCTPGSYTIVEGDSTRLEVAERFDLTVEALDAANADTPGYSAFYPGLEIVIPPATDC